MSVISKLQIILEANTTAFDRTLAKTNDTLGKFSKKTQEMHKKMDRFARINRGALEGLQSAGQAAAIGLGVMAIGIKGAVTAAVDFEKSMAGVKKVVEFETPAQFKQMEQDIIALSQRLPMAASDIAAIIEAAGQSGIAREELSRFAESAIKMGVAFDITAEEAGKAMAEMRASFGMTQSEVEVLADQINYLGNNSTNSAPQIMEVVQRIGSLAETANISSATLAALTASMVGVAPEVAATSLKNFSLQLVKGESLSKSAKKAFKTMGLDYKQIAKDMQVDSEGTIRKVLEAAQKVPEHMRAAVLNDAFGSESIAAISQLVTNYDAVDKNLKAMGDSAAYAGSMLKEFEGQAATSAAQMQVFDNNIQAMKIAFGATFLPVLNQAMEAITPVLKRITEWAQKNPELVATITAVTAGVLGVVATLGGLALAFTAVTSGIGTILSIGAMIATIVKPIISALGFVKMFGAALAALGFPVAAVVAGIAALVAAGVALYMNWDTVKAKAMEVWRAIPQYAGQAWQWLQGVWRDVGAWFGSAWEGVVTSISVAWAGIKLAIAAKLDEIKQAFFDWLAGMPKPVQDMVANIISFFDGMVAVWSGIKTAAQDVWRGVKEEAQSAAQAISSKWQAFTQTVSEIWGNIKDSAKSAWHDVKDSAVSAWHDVVNITKSIIDTLTGVIKVGLAVITGIWQTQFAAIKSLVGVVFEAIKAYLSTWFNSAKAVLTAGLTIFASVFNAGFDLIKNVFSTAFAVIEALVRGDMQGVAAAIRTGLSNAAGIIRTMIANIVGAFKNLGSQLLQAGRDAIQGFINGVRQKMTEALNTAREMASKVYQTVKSALDIRSPSRKMKKLGEHTAEGMAEGIKKATPKAVKQAKQMAEKIQKTVADAVADLKREIALFGDDSAVSALRYDIGTGKYKGANTAELESLTAQKYALERNQTVLDEIASIQKQMVTHGFDRLQLLEWEIAHTSKYKDVAGDVLDDLKAKTAEQMAFNKALEEQNKITQANDRAKSNYDSLQKQIALFGNASKVVEFDYDWANGAFDGADHMLLLRERDALVKLEHLQHQNKTQSAFEQLKNELAGELSPLDQLKKALDERLQVITEFENAHTGVELQAQQARQQAEQAYLTAKTNLMLDGYQNVFHGISGMTKAFFGEQSGIYRAMFAMEKSFVIAKAILALKANIAEASKAGFPKNIPLIASALSQGMGIINDIRAIATPIGQAHDGIMSVPKSGTWNLEKGKRVLPRHTAKAMDDKLAKIGNGGARVIINNYSGEKATAQQMPNGDIMVQIGAIMKQVGRAEAQQVVLEELGQGGLISRRLK